MVERGRLEALRECMMSGVTCHVSGRRRWSNTLAVAASFGEQENTEQVNCVVSSMLQAGPLYPQLLTYRCGAANRRFGPQADISQRLQHLKNFEGPTTRLARASGD